MKKFLSILCVLTLVVGILAVSAVSASAAAEPAKTAVDVKNGNEVTYTLKLSGVADPIIGCDYSVYYDPSIFEVTEVSDFNNKTSENEWEGLINTKLSGEIRGNWSILKGIKFNEERNFISVKLKAKAEGTTEISYYIRYMYDNNIFNSDDKPQITDYKFVCDVNVDGDIVLEDAQPELNTTETQNTGLFVNSVTGDSNDADPDIPGTVVKKNGANSSNNSGGSGDNGNSGGADGGSGNTPAAGNPAIGYGSGAQEADKTSSAAGEKIETAAPAATTAEGYFVTATDAEGNVTATSDEAPVVVLNGDKSNKGLVSSPWFWVIIALIVLAGGGVAAFMCIRKKPTGAGDMPVSADDADNQVTVDTAAAGYSDSENTVALNTGDEKTMVLDEDKDN